RRQHVNVDIVDSGGSIAFQFPPSERAGPGHLALGFRAAHASRIGTVETVLQNSPFWSPGCAPAPAESFQDASGCGAKKVPWDMEPIEVGNEFQPQVFAFLPTKMLVSCPIFGKFS